MKMALTVFTVGSTLIQGWAAMFLSALLAQGIQGLTGFGFWKSVLIVIAGRIAINKPKVDMPALKRAIAQQEAAKAEARKQDLRAKVSDFR